MSIRPTRKKATLTTRGRVVVGGALVVLALVLAAVAFQACGDDDNGEAAPSTTAAPVETPDVALTEGPITVFGVADGAELPAADTMVVLAASEQYVEDAMVAPLVGDAPGDEFTAQFGSDVQSLVVANGRDRAVLTDEGIPVATTTPTVTTTPVAVDALIAADGTPLLLVTEFEAKTTADTKSGRVSVNRTVQLTFERSGTDWLVTAYQITATREGIEPAATTTTANSEEDA